MLLRILCLLRLSRMARLVKNVQALDTLQILVLSIKACVSIGVWSGCALMGIMTMVGIFLNGQLADYITDEAGLDYETRSSLYSYFGSYTRSLLTMFEITLGNFVPVCRLLLENVNEGYAALICIYKFLVGFAVVKVISGVFLHETFRVAGADDELMVVQKTRAVHRHINKMMRLMTLTDTSGNGMLDRSEFIKVMKDPTIKTWLAAMDIEVDDIGRLFDCIDNGDGNVTAEELIRGVSKLRGSARSIDMRVMLSRTTKVLTRVDAVASAVEQLREAASKNALLWQDSGGHDHREETKEAGNVP
eukprot:NODE_1698_length_1080_cov_271.745366.p1 GENE.NODE_1698_length_1080_cov_271.745366~~NODE_1698_length_1080_cov_271.745366.p1  ORF type:complete len:337 (-),score=120.11 NODE_1698_length_1080_cov_271.745366:52-963(-)